VPSSARILPKRSVRSAAAASIGADSRGGANTVCRRRAAHALSAATPRPPATALRRADGLTACTCIGRRMPTHKTPPLPAVNVACSCSPAGLEAAAEATSAAAEEAVAVESPLPKTTPAQRKRTAVRSRSSKAAASTGASCSAICTSAAVASDSRSCGGISELISDELGPRGGISELISEELGPRGGISSPRRRSPGWGLLGAASASRIPKGHNDGRASRAQPAPAVAPATTSTLSGALPSQLSAKWVAAAGTV
jgi:hypothetical protein